MSKEGRISISKSDLEMMRSFYVAMSSPQWASNPYADRTRRAFFALLCRLSKDEANEEAAAVEAGDKL